MNTFDKIDNLMKAQRKKQIDLTNYLNVPKATYTAWKTGRTHSYNKYLAKIAEFLGVSVDYLLENEGGTLDKEENEKILLPSFRYSDHEKQVIFAYRNHPELQMAVDRLLGIGNDGKIMVYTAANSESNKPDKTTFIDLEKWEELKSISDTDEDLK